ncbi:oleate hydratase [Lysinibacillus sp. MHQ-1]|nr:oleate hydratase [Lysinibacillus sp. MHQ-1]
MGVPVDEIPDIAQNSCNTIPCYMPYITSYFMPRAMGGSSTSCTRRLC